MSPRVELQVAKETRSSSIVYNKMRIAFCASEGINCQHFVTVATVEVRVLQTYVQFIFMLTVNPEPDPRRIALPNLGSI